MVSVARTLFRLLGWLLTPLVAWAASFVGAWLGSLLFGGVRRPMTGFWITLLFGVASALIAAHSWLRLLRRSPKLQEALAVGPDGTPLVALEAGGPKEGA